MSEIPDRNPGDLIESEFSNELIERTFQRYANDAGRDALEPAPEEGSLSWIAATELMAVWQNPDWVDYITNLEFDPLAAQVEINKAAFDTVKFQRANQSGVNSNLSSVRQTMISVSAPATGDYVFRGAVDFTLTVSPGTNFLRSINTVVNVGGSDKNRWEYGLTSEGGGLSRLGLNQTFMFPLKNLAQGTVVALQAWTDDTADILFASYNEPYARLQNVPKGLLQ